MENGTGKKSVQFQVIGGEKLIILLCSLNPWSSLCYHENPEGDVKILLNFAKHVMSMTKLEGEEEMRNGHDR